MAAMMLAIGTPALADDAFAATVPPCKVATRAGSRDFAQRDKWSVCSLMLWLVVISLIGMGAAQAHVTRNLPRLGDIS